MSQASTPFLSALTARLGDQLTSISESPDMVTLELSAAHLIGVCQVLCRDEVFSFEMLIDICGVDYLEYGVSDWRTESTTATGFSRAVAATADEKVRVLPWDKPRFAVVYHLLSLKHNRRLRLKVFLAENALVVPSVMEVWEAANWFEREAYDLFGIVFDGHPDLRRLLTDYGFKGHPFRKDFPLIGEVELRYDAAQGRCVYEPVSIQPRVLVPKVVRDDSRYLQAEGSEGNPHG